MYSTAEFKNGLKIELDGEPFTIVEFQHVKPGKGGAFVRTKLKALKSGKVIERTFRSGEKVDKPDVEERRCSSFMRQPAATISWMLELRAVSIFRGSDREWGRLPQGGDGGDCTFP